MHVLSPNLLSNFSWPYRRIYPFLPKRFILKPKVISGRTWAGTQLLFAMSPAGHSSPGLGGRRRPQPRQRVLLTPHGSLLRRPPPRRRAHAQSILKPKVFLKPKVSQQKKVHGLWLMKENCTAELTQASQLAELYKSQNCLAPV